MRSGVERSNRRDGLVAHASNAIGRAVEGVVVDHDRHAVGGALHIELDGVDAATQPALERRDGVLGRQRQRAAMSDHEHWASQPAQVRTTHGH